MKSKKQLRKEMLSILKGISDSQYQLWSNEIAGIFFKHEFWQQSKTIGIVISRKPEVNTTPIIQHAWECGKQIVVPKCHPNTRAMTFHEITSYDQLEIVYSGLQEPNVDKTVEVSKADIDLMIVPGLMYTKKGYRLGFGGGYYDRYLADYSGKKLALAFEAQIVNELPIDVYDIPVDKIITNKEVMTCDRE